jgi:putative transposase
LLKANDWTATREVVEAVRNEFRIGRSTVYRMIARFRASRKASSLIPAGRGTPDGAKRLDIRTERLIGQQIDRFWLKKEKPKMRALIQRVHEACRIEGLPPPHRSTIQRRVDELDALGAARRRGEVSLEAEVTPSGSHTSGHDFQQTRKLEKATRPKNARCSLCVNSSVGSRSIRRQINPN